MKPQYSGRYKTIGKNIAFYRTVKGYNQTQFIEKLDKSYEHIGRIENGKTGMSLDLLFLISDTLEVPIEKFFEDRY